jgi:hypothetical protein
MALGALAGFFSARIAFATAESALHVLVGFFAGVAERVVHPSPEAPRWLQALFWIAFACGAFLILHAVS